MLEYPHSLLLRNPPPLLDLLAQIAAITVLQSHNHILIILVSIVAPHNMFGLQLHHDFDFGLQQFLPDGFDSGRLLLLDFYFADHFQGDYEVGVRDGDTFVDVAVGAVAQLVDAEVVPHLEADGAGGLREGGQPVGRLHE